MILPGRTLIPRIVSGVRSPNLQAQPCGIDLTLKRIFTFTSAGTVDFGNSLRRKASYAEIAFGGSSQPERASPIAIESSARQLQNQSTQKPQEGKNDVAKSVFLAPGSYSVEFNEMTNVPLDMMGQIFTRSSLFRSGAFVVTGVVDSGFCGPLGGLLVVSNTHGIRLMEGAKLAQIVFHQMTEEVEGYSGVYQGAPFV